MAQRKDIGRLALRVEGSMWNAYYAPMESMEGAVLLGGIAMRIIGSKPARKDAFMRLMSEAVSDLIEDFFGQRPDWNEPTTAPPAERAGNA